MKIRMWSVRSFFTRQASRRREKRTRNLGAAKGASEAGLKSIRLPSLQFRPGVRGRRKLKFMMQRRKGMMRVTYGHQEGG